MSDAPYFYSYFAGRGRELLALQIRDWNPCSLPGTEIVERILAAGYGPDLDHVQRVPFPVAENMAVVNREGQTFVVSIDTEAETIAVQEQRDDAYERGGVTRYTGPAMTLGNMRKNGVRSILAACACGHGSSINVDSLPDFVEVPAIRQRVKCSACGARPMDVRPDWREAHRREKPEPPRARLKGLLSTIGLLKREDPEGAN